MLSSFCYSLLISISLFFFFFFNDTATTEIYTLSLHDALPISARRLFPRVGGPSVPGKARRQGRDHRVLLCFDHGVPYPDRKSTRLNSSHSQISYAVFCLKKKKKENNKI